MNIAVWILEGDNKMKTLVNKRNPAIKIIADTLLSDSFNYITSFCSVPKSDWTLVEEEQKPVDLEKVTQHYTYLIPQTFEEKVEMYMKCEKKTLAEMLAMRDIIMAHKNPPQEPVLTKTE